MVTSLEPRRWQRGGSPASSRFADPIDRWFRDFDDFFNASSGLLPSMARWADTGPACDLRETDENYVVSIDIPGVKNEDIDIDVSGNVLTVRGERKEEYGVGERQRSSMSEMRYGEFERSFTLPSDVDTSKVEATTENGVLHLVVPKAGEAKRHKIAIKEEGSRLLGKVKEAIGIGGKKESSAEERRT